MKEGVLSLHLTSPRAEREKRKKSVEKEASWLLYLARWRTRSIGIKMQTEDASGCLEIGG